MRVFAPGGAEAATSRTAGGRPRTSRRGDGTPARAPSRTARRERGTLPRTRSHPNRTWRARSRSQPRRSPVEVREELSTAEHALELVAPLRVVQQLDSRVRRVTWHLLDAKVAGGDGRDLRQVR